jgi:hypothetical protein
MSISSNSLQNSNRQQFPKEFAASSFTGRSNPPTGALDDLVKPLPICLRKLKLGGAYRDRTDDLLNANQALSQLS